MGLEPWRVIFHQPLDGATNMAIDQAIMEAVGTGTVPPTLRFYAWSPACLSLGYAQHADEVDLKRLDDAGWDIVRRPTGGKAILHTDELTYSISAPDTHPIMRGGILESYQRISEALLAGLSLLQVDAMMTSKEAAGRAEGPVCFEVPSNFEVTSGGRKLIGSAQVRRQKTVLQHGTIPLYGDVARICDVLVYENEVIRDWARAQVRERAITLEEALGRRVSWQATADALSRGFQERFNIRLVPGDLSDEESLQAKTLSVTTYAESAWTQRR